MNTSTTFKTVVLSLAAAGSLLAAGVARAGVAWSVDIGVPGVAAVVANQPVYRPVPRVYVAPPVVYAPVPVYAPPPVVEYVPAPVGYFGPPRFYRTAPVVAPVVVYPEHHHAWRVWEHWHDGRWDGRR